MKTYCFFSAQYLPRLGGVERYTYNLAKKLIESGNQVIVVTSEMENCSWQEEKEGIQIYRLPSFQLMGGRFPILKYNHVVRKIIKKLNDIPIDYAVINTRLYLLSYFGAVYARKRGINSILIEHGTGHMEMGNTVLNFCGSIYEHVLTVMIKKNVQDYYGVSGECNGWLQHFHIAAKGVLYNSIDLEQIQQLRRQDATAIKKKVEFQDDDFIITFTGRLIEQKGVLKLIQAVDLLHSEYPQMKLCIAGDGELQQKLEALHRDYVKLMGRLEFEQVIQLLKITSVYCLPTDYPEGLPTSVLEAIACEVYVVTTQAGGSKEIITEKAYGTILKENTVQEIADTLRWLVENEADRKSAIQKAYHRVRQEFTWNTTARHLVEIFEKQD